jgi:hypothetical protein
VPRREKTRHVFEKKSQGSGFPNGANKLWHHVARIGLRKLLPGDREWLARRSAGN